VGGADATGQSWCPFDDPVGGTAGAALVDQGHHPKEFLMKARTGVLATAAAALLVAGAVLAGTGAPTGLGRTGAVSQALTAKSATTNAQRVQLTLRPSTPKLQSCFPKAEAKVTVDLTTATRGFDTFTIKAKGLRPKTDYTVFLLEQSGSPFGAAQYSGDFTTNARGEAVNQFRLIVEEAFAFNNVTQQRTDLNAVGVWFADEKDDDECLGAGSPVTGFDGDGKAGVQMLNSGTALLP
jgi:hypothetical protein